MASHRLSISYYLFPIGTLVLALAIRFARLSVHEEPMAVRVVVLLAVVSLIFVTVFIVLHHAETVAVRIGEPYGTLLLTFAVTVIEASVIVSMMLHDEGNPTLARESVFSTVMIVCTGVVGICLTFGGWRHHYQDIKRQGTNALLAMLMALAVLCLVLPDFTLGGGPQSFSQAQLAFVSGLSILLYGAFVFAQMSGHRQDFVEELTIAETGVRLPASSSIVPSVVLLFVGLAGIVLIAEEIANRVEDALEVWHVPQADAIVGAFIATLVLLPEAVSAIRAALNNELQRGLNVALGSACATIGLTFPVVGATTLITGKELTLGLDPGDIVLLLLALGVSVLSFGTGRTTILTGLVHLVIFVSYLMLIMVP